MLSGVSATMKWYGKSALAVYPVPPTSYGLAGVCGGRPGTGSLIQIAVSEYGSYPINHTGHAKKASCYHPIGDTLV